MPSNSSKPASVSSRFRSFWFNLLDLPDDDHATRLINSQLATASPQTGTSASQFHLLRYHQSIANSSRATRSTTTINNQLLNPPSRFGSLNRCKTADQQLAPRTGDTGEQVQFANSNQNSVYCVSSVNLSRLAFEDQQQQTVTAGGSGGRSSSNAQPVVKLTDVPTPTQLTIATELPTATKFASFVDRQPQRPTYITHKKEFFNLEQYDQYENMAICAVLLTIMSIALIICTLPFSLFFCIKVVQEYERAVIFRLGRLVTGGERGPGIFFIIPCIDTYTKVDLRTVSFDVPPQEILSKDSVTVAVDAVVYFRINNAIASVSNVEDYARSTRLLAATTLSNVLGTKNLSEILSERESISHMIQTSLDEATESWGVKVERVEIKDVRLPVQLQRAMAAEAEATREARAKVIAAEGEQRASRALKEAAEVISDSPAALQLRYLQTLSSIAAENNSTIVFPVPMELFRGFIHDEDEHQSESNKHSHHHSHQHHHSHLNHLHHDQTGEFEEYKQNVTCAEIEQYDTNCMVEPTITSGLNNFNPEEFLHADLESPVPKYHKE